MCCKYRLNQAAKIAVKNTDNPAAQRSLNAFIAAAFLAYCTGPSWRGESCGSDILNPCFALSCFTLPSTVEKLAEVN
ncbi:hypothetical protein DXX93_19335 [Thalassotalea euphylliae]|uniref:Uncharacterized protein n=1 Tax=Thalassotalea euphylliae TaxID=1655234 RepID=A0A3E0TV02_9GAMM|nr:hypothetical protein DXX93_19335 [Thalassotalea euphylliae]